MTAPLEQAARVIAGKLPELSHDFDDCPLDCHEAGVTIAQALADAGLLSQWRGIESAPKDGTNFLAYEPEGDTYRAAYHREGYLMAFCGQPVVQPPEPTHWQPLPSPPPQAVGGPD